MDVLITIFMVIAGFAIAVVLISFLFWIAVVAGAVGLVAYGLASITGMPFWGAFVLVAIVAGIGYLFFNFFN